MKHGRGLLAPSTLLPLLALVASCHRLQEIEIPTPTPTTNTGDSESTPTPTPPTSNENTPSPTPTSTPTCTPSPSSCTKLLLHAEDFADAACLHSPQNSGVALNSTYRYFGTTSFYFNGTSKIVIPNKGHFDFGSSDFTIDFWMRPAAIDSDDGIFQLGPNQQDAYNLSAFLWVNKLHVILNGAATIDDRIVINAPPVDAWVHVAIVRNNNTLKVYYNGIEKGTFNVQGRSVTGKDLLVGNYWANGYNYVGYLDEFRIVDRAVWTSDFTPPTSPHINGCN